MSVSPPTHRVLVVCIGNALVADDSVGCVIHDRLAALTLPADVRLELVGVGGMTLVDELQGEEALIVVDAVQLATGPAGTIHVLEWEDLPAASGTPVSVHGIGVREAIEVARRLYPERLPRRVVLVGIEGRCFDRIGPEMTREVEAAVPAAVSSILSLIGSVLEPSSDASRT